MTANTLNSDAAEVLLKVSRERKLGVFHIASIGRMLTRASSEEIGSIIQSIVQASQRAGDDALAFDRFMLLVAQNRNLNNKGSFAAALDMASDKPRRGPSLLPALGLFLTGGLAAGLVGAAAITAAQLWTRHKATASLEWEPLRASVAGLDVLLNLSPQPSALLSVLRARACPERDESVGNAAAIVREIVTPYLVKYAYPKTASDKMKQVKILKDAMHSEVAKLDIEINLIYNAIDEHFSADSIDFIFFIWGFINQRDYNEKRQIVREILENSLNEAFAVAEYPEAAKSSLILGLADQLLAHQPLLDSVRPRPAFPEKAPTKWVDRNPGETAPEFVRRVYGPWLDDGLSKRALRKIDAALIQELYAWTRSGNEMPSDIRLLTVSEENQRLIEAGPEAIRQHVGKFTGAEAYREAARLRAAETRQR